MKQIFKCETFDIEVTLADIVRGWQTPYETDEIDDRLARFLAEPKSAKNQTWLKAIRNGLRLTLSDVAAKLAITRQAAYQIEVREAASTITISSLKVMAELYGCDFIYGFVPKDHKTFSEMLAHNIVPLIQKPEPVMRKPRIGYAIMLAARINKYLNWRKAKWRLTRPRGFEV